MIRSFLLLAVLVSLAYLILNMLGSPSAPQEIKSYDKLVVVKSKRLLHAYSNGRLARTYSISLGKQPLGDKKVGGDNKTPEGRYTINDKNPYSSYHKNLGISYPSKADRREAAKLGKPAGGEIKIHGLPDNMAFIGKLHRLYDWTAGCLAVTNEEMDELFRLVPIGTPIEIRQ